jgi:hypothetical protein
MKGFVKQVAVLSLGAVALVAAPMHAQVKPQFLVAGGLGLPLGDFGDAFKMGFQGTAGVSFAPASLPVGIQIDGNFAQFSIDNDALDVKDRMIYGTANAVYNFKTAATSKLHPYLIGGLGVYNAKPTGDDATGAESTTKFGINAGAGFNVAAGGASVFVEGRFHDVFTEGSATQFVPILVGLRFGGK